MRDRMGIGGGNKASLQMFDMDALLYSNPPFHTKYFRGGWCYTRTATYVTRKNADRGRKNFHIYDTIHLLVPNDALKSVPTHARKRRYSTNVWVCVRTLDMRQEKQFLANFFFFSLTTTLNCIFAKVINMGIASQIVGQ